MKLIEKIDELIIGRVEPHIYAFTTNTIPNYLKIGDTYRPLLVRLNEWRKHYSNLKFEFEAKATINSEIFFRDYSVHDYLINRLGKQRLLAEDMADYPAGTHYSKEFFKNTSIEDVQKAISDIKCSYKKHDNTYHFYNSSTALPEKQNYASSGYWEPRSLQQKAIDNFVKAVDNGRTNLLMYAVMRFGKSFTSLCCAKEKNYKVVLVVSAKAEVGDEWKKTVESADNFNKEYIFLTVRELINGKEVIKTARANGQGVVIFITLQDLQGSKRKEKHRELFENEIDLLIIDETHYGARAESYGQIIRTAGYPNDIKIKFSDEDNVYVDAVEAGEQLKSLKVKVKLHLSGTPYRILMGSEFSKEDIISFCQFSDIVKEQEKWDKEFLLSDNKEHEEWKNPYYGFPQMIRFAFNPSASAIALLKELKSNGTTYTLSELFKPASISKSKDNSHKKFIHEKEALDLFEAIDGSKEDESIFAFLDYDKIHEGKMCRHMVIVLPYCASCDALENLLISHATEFKNLSQYEIINISGVDGGKNYKTVRLIKEKIKRCEREDKKTITLTVNRMLTGSTVAQWDTMIFLKDTASPQEYDQAIFRIQNQYLKSYRDDRGEVITYNMKPQTLLVDFDPHRMFIMQEQKSLLYGLNTDSNIHEHLKDIMESELKISPIITCNKGKITQVEATDIISVVSEYSRSRGVLDEAKDLPVDNNLFSIDAIKEEIERQAELGAKGGLKTEAHQGNTTDYDDAGHESEGDNRSSGNEGNPSRQEGSEEKNEYTLQVLQNKFKTYYSRILFFVFLSEDKVSSLSELVEKSDSPDNLRIMKNLNIDLNILNLMLHNMNSFILNRLDLKIHNISNLSHDETVTPIDRAITAMGKFGKLSESEITTPISVASQTIDLLPDKCFTTLDRNNKILDIASKMGEFAIAVYKKCINLELDPKDISDSIVSIPTSTIAYEFTRKVYRILGLNTNCISSQFNSYDLLKVKTDDNIVYKKIGGLLKQNEFINQVTLDDVILERNSYKVNFNAVVGNPPYQEEAETTSKNNAQKPRKNIFQHFVMQADELSNDNAVIIFPGLRWIHQSGKGLKKFGMDLINSPRLDKLIFYPKSNEIFEGVDIPDGISIVHLGEKCNHKTFEYVYVSEGIRTVMNREKPGKNLLVVNPNDISIINKIVSFVAENKLNFLHDAILPRSLFGIESDFVDTYAGDMELYNESMNIDFTKKIKVLTNDKSGPAGRSRWFVVDKDAIKQNKELVNKWQVVVSSAHPGGQDGRDNQIEIIDNHSAFGRARVALRSFDTKEEAINFIKFANSYFIKFAFLMSDESLTSLAKYVPDLTDYSDSNKIIDFTKDIDIQISKLLKLTEGEVQYIAKQMEKV